MVLDQKHTKLEADNLDTSGVTIVPFSPQMLTEFINSGVQIHFIPALYNPSNGGTLTFLNQQTPHWFPKLTHAYSS